MLASNQTDFVKRAAALAPVMKTAKTLTSTVAGVYAGIKIPEVIQGAFVSYPMSVYSATSSFKCHNGVCYNPLV